MSEQTKKKITHFMNLLTVRVLTWITAVWQGYQQATNLIVSLTTLRMERR